MLELLRKASKTVVAKALFILLIASFGIWGASQRMEHGSSSTVLTVGDQKINVGEFRLAFQRQVANLSQQLGTQLSTDQAKAFGVEQQLYAELSAGAALDQLASDMKLGLSEERLARLIADDPAFKSVNGAFDRQLFESRLRNAGLAPDQYIAERSKVAVRGQIVDAVSDGFSAPKALVDALTLYRDESRTVDYLLLSNANIDPIKTPADDVLSKWFEGVKARYRAPEFRKIAVVHLTPEDIADPSTVTDDAIKAEFEKRKESFKTPASRTIEQLSFPNKEMAEAAEAALKTGVTFDQLVKDQDKTEADILLGEFTKDKVPDPAIAEAAFAVTKDGGTTDVVDGSFGPVILRISKIKAESARDFESVKDEIRKELALVNASEEILNVHDRFEDLRASGMTISQVADQLKLKTMTIEAVDANGQGPDGNAVKDIPESKKLLDAAFKAEQGAETTPLAAEDNGYVWYEIVDVKPEHDRTLAEVKDKAVADWTAEQQAAALAAKTEELAKQVKGGKALSDIATEMGLQVENKSGLKRGSEDTVLGRGAIAAAFSGPVGTVAHDLSADGTGQILLKVTDVAETATTDALSPEQDVTGLARAAGDDILDQMVARLQAEYGVTVNRDLAQQAMTLR
ncbi:peptidylprolyl isomerase [Gellertiella hungarica]|uniref:Parvulin-like PPIase n=1 Tax=Gellertiella hungarica TaxID=1572859 RepID=A0A7W6J6K1_9HYPH|nr:peptidylprolyl isomerase [Gellertiella hungarica]MBB4064848.1 peptidyl-prolyl cis-trans isomerase D [Gellertiella hungarica]